MMGIDFEPKSNQCPDLNVTKFMMFECAAAKIIPNPGLLFQKCVEKTVSYLSFFLEQV
jgi:hypothetical protein